MAIKTTHREIAEFIEAAAREQRTVTYSDVVAAHPDLPKLNPLSSHPLYKLLSVLDSEDQKYGRPFRSALVVAQRTKIPGQGFFIMLKKFRAQRMLKSEHEEYWQAEKRDVFEYYR